MARVKWERGKREANGKQCNAEDLPGNGARNSSCYLLSTALDFPEEERMMQQSSVSISLSF